MKVLFVGGPWDGRAHPISEDALRHGWRVPVVGGGVVVYARRAYVLAGLAIDVMVAGAEPSPAAVVGRLIELAGLTAREAVTRDLLP